MPRTAPYLLDEANKSSRVPGVTTVIGRYGDRGGLLHWAWKMGCDGKDYRAERDEAAHAGTLAHNMIEDHIHGRMPAVPDGTDEEIAGLAEQGFRAYLEWADMANVEATHTEIRMVSQRMRVGGTPDLFGWTGRKTRKRALLDWKTSNHTYPGHIVQLAAYGAMWNEQYPSDPIRAYHLLRFGKTHADFHHHNFTLLQMKTALKAFVNLREMYDLYKEVGAWT